MAKRFLVLFLLLLAIGGTVAAPAALGQSGDERISIREVDATDPANVAVTFSYGGERADVADATIRHNGDLVDLNAPIVPLDDTAQLGIVLLIDTSFSMEDNGLIARVLAAARQFIENKAPADQLAVVTFDARVQVLQELTADKDQLLGAIDRIVLADQTHIYDGIARSAALLADAPNLQPNIVVFSDGHDSGSATTLEQAAGALQNIGGALFAMGVPNDGFSKLEATAAATGGVASLADDPDGVAGLFTRVQETLRKQYVATYASPAESGSAQVQVTVGDQQALAEIVVGSSQEGAATLEPKVVSKPGGPAFFRSETGLAALLVLALVGAGLLAWSLGNTFLSGEQSLSSVLQPYDQGYVGTIPDDDSRDHGLAQTPFLQRAVEMTGQLAERQGLLTKLEGMLERANIPLRPAELMFFYAAGVVVVGVLAFVVAPPVVALGVIGFSILAPLAVLSFLAGKRRRQFETQLPDTLQLLASTLRAGYSLMQGVEAVSQEVTEPMGRELRRVVTEARLGRPLEESLDGVASRMDSSDFAWAVMAIRIQREVGGNLAELLVTVADTMTERERLRRDVRALTAEGRISAIVLGILPLGLGFFIYTLNPAYMDPLFDKTIGQVMLGGSILLALFGFWWMKKTIEVEI